MFDLFRRAGPREVPGGVPAPDADRELALFMYPSCPFCARVLRHIDKLGLEVPSRHVHREPQAMEELVRRTGRRTVPMLLIDGEPLHESLDIMAWLSAYAEREA